MHANIDTTLENARDLIDGFAAETAAIASVPRGVLTSEIFFIRAATGAHRPRQIVESGRALGQSTLLLARCFPQTPVISIEHDVDHPDAPRALERLRDQANVSCLFGDARVLMPELTLPGDVVVIDGPKELRALKLAMDVIRRAGPALVFIHDCYRGSLIREHMQRHLPWVFYSDDPRWVASTCRLDRSLGDAVLERWSSPQRMPADRSYAGTFACLAPPAGFPARADFVRRDLARIGENLSAAVTRRPRRAEPHPCEADAG